MSNKIEPRAPGAASARERILVAAHELFYRDGIRATGVDKLIAEAGVTKVTFYRHFRSKDDLVRAFLDDRHDRWLHGFARALARHRAAQSPSERSRAPLAPVHLAMADWLADPAFRGCAFINTVAELGGVLPDVFEIAAAHKRDMAMAIFALLPAEAVSMSVAQAAALAVDGAIVRAQTGGPALALALAALQDLLGALTKTYLPSART